MSFNRPIRHGPIPNSNGSLSDASSHFAAYTLTRAEQGNPVKYFGKNGMPEGFHHERHASVAHNFSGRSGLPPNTVRNGVGLPIAASHKFMAGCVRDDVPKHVFDESIQVPSRPVMFHSPPPAVDYRALAHFAPSAVKNSDWKVSALGVHYVATQGRKATSIGSRSPEARPTQTRAESSSRGIASGFTVPVESLPAAGRKTKAFVRPVRACTLHDSTYPKPEDAVASPPTYRPRW